MYEACMCVPEFGVFLGDLGFVFRIISPLSVINICTEYIYIGCWFLNAVRLGLIFESPHVNRG